ncbi:nad dependent epimerase dehydratase [Podospora conica]|nr:nad dependent epimerase dehydratase [Schizothecium conicum]
MADEQPPLVLITGSSGHLGTALMLSLPSLGFTPIGIDILPSPTTTLVVDITSAPAVQSVFNSHPRITAVIHTATLHKPHVSSHPKSAFIATNITGTLNLLEAFTAHLAAQPTTAALSPAFVFISTTSAFGSALSPPPGAPAAWIDESVVPRPKNIYGATKLAAEDLCALAHKESGLPTVVLRTSRFFPEADDDADRRAELADDNLKVCELAYRRVDIADVVSACVCAMRRAGAVGFGKYIVSAPPPVERGEEVLRMLDCDAGVVMRQAVPGAEEVFGERGWGFQGRVDRVYDSAKAVRELGWEPEWTFGRVVERLRRGERLRSELTERVGLKGYHAVSTGVYTVR